MILYEQKTLGELNVWEYLEQVRGWNPCKILCLPFQIKKVTLRDVGQFEYFEADFRRDDVNLIFGFTGTGKSTILRSIAYCFGFVDRYFNKLGRCGRAGAIEVEIYNRNNHITAMVDEECLEIRFVNSECVLMDDPFQWITVERIREYLTNLKRMGRQIIVTSKQEEVKKVLRNKNMILLKNST